MFLLKVPEVLDDAVSGPTVRVGDSDGEIWHERQPSWVSESDEDSELEPKTCQIATVS